MRAHFRPKVILVARPELVLEGVDEVLAEYGPAATWSRGPGPLSDGDGLAELMGRLCYGSFGPAQGRVGAREYMANVMGLGRDGDAHGSVLEHACWSFVICRASRGLANQVVRHRAGFAFSGESTHFVRYSSGGAPGQPEAAVCLAGMEPGGEEARAAEAACAEAVKAYEALWTRLRAMLPGDVRGAKKIACSTARGVLPIAIESRLGFTANGRALRHFCELRGAEENVLEARLVAADVAAIMAREAPAMFQDVWVEAAGDGHPVVRSRRRKV